MGNLTGERIGEFDVAELIAMGGFADVYRAYQPGLQRWVALKVLRVEEQGPRSRSRFEREARIASMVDHPLSTHVYACGQHGDMPWIAMEYVRGESLEQWLRVRGPVSFEVFLAFFEPLLRVVYHLHELGIVHRDLKPSNIMVIEVEGERLPKVLDLGIARLLHESSELASQRSPQVEAASEPEDGLRTVRDPLTVRDRALGSARYMPPEQWKNPHDAVPESDIYALAIILFEALTGKPPFIGETRESFKRLHLFTGVPSIGGELARDLDPLMKRALAKDPDERFHSPLELLSELRKVQAARLRRRIHRFRLLIVGLAASLAVALVAGIAFGVLHHLAKIKADFAEEHAIVAQQNAENLQTQLEVERGRAALLPRETDPASHLAEGYLRGDHSPGTKFMLARALQSRVDTKAIFQGTGRAWSAVFSPDNQRIVTTDDAGARVWDANHFNLLFALPVHGEVYQALYTGHQRLMTVSQDAVRLWTPDGAPVRELSAPRSDGGPPDYFVAASRGDLIAAIDSRGAIVHVWSEKSGALLAELHVPPAGFPCLTFSTDGRWLAASGGASGVVFETKRWTPAVELPGQVVAMAFAPASSQLLAGTRAGDVSIWSVATGKMTPVSEEATAVLSVAWSPNRAFLAVGREDGKEQLWRIGSHKPQSELYARHAKIESIEFDATSRRVLTAGADGAVVVADVESGKLISMLEGPTALIATAHFDTTSQRVLAASWDGTTRIWDISASYLRWHMPAIDSHCKTVTSSDGTAPIIAIACKDQPTKVWNISQGKLIAEFPSVQNESPVTRELVPPALPDTRDHIAIARGNYVEVYRLSDAKLVRSIEHPAHVSAVVFAGSNILSGAIDGSLMFTKAEKVTKLPFSLGGIDVVAELPNHQILSIDAERQLRLYSQNGSLASEIELPVRAAALQLQANGARAVVLSSFMNNAEPPVLIDLENRRIISRLEGHVGYVVSARWIDDQIFTSGGDGTARQWNGLNGQSQGSYKVSSRMVVNTSFLNGFLLTADIDGLLHFSDPRTYSHLWALQVAHGPILVIHSGEDEIVTVSQDGELTRWNIPKSERIIQACGQRLRCVTMDQ